MTLFSALAAYLSAYTLAYVGLFFLFPIFFQQTRQRLSIRSVYSMLGILVVCVLFFNISNIMPDEQLGNRVLHAMAGGFTAFFLCYRAACDSKVAITKFQFFVFSALMVTTLGVGNEIAEFVGQNYAGIIFAPSINDTWLDLISNTVGILLGALCFVPLFKKR